jgi:uncharacterized cofD-like protein
MKNVVIIGAGTGQSQILKGLVGKKEISLTSIVNVTDNGGSSKAVRDSMNMPAPGDLRRCIETLSQKGVSSDMFSFRFGGEPLAGMSLGNLLLAFHTQRLGDIGKASEYISKELHLKGAVYPATTDSVNVCVELKNGQKICGEWEIIRRRSTSMIKRVFLKPSAKAYSKALVSIKKADCFIIAPGSLYTGIIPILLMKGVRSLVMSSKAKKIYVSNIMSQPGQTEGMSISDHISEVERYMGCSIDFSILNSLPIPDSILRLYRQVGSSPLVEGSIPTRIKVVKTPLIKTTIPKDIENELKKSRTLEKWTHWTHILRHDPKKVSRAIMKNI